jgi:hypothetical protein
MNNTPLASAADLAADKTASDALSAAALDATASQFMPATPGAAVGHVAIKLPAFWTSEPELWFFFFASGVGVPAGQSEMQLD